MRQRCVSRPGLRKTNLGALPYFLLQPPYASDSPFAQHAHTAPSGGLDASQPFGNVVKLPSEEGARWVME